MRTISAADANRYFSKLVREVAAGESVVVTSRGRPVARIVPVDEHGELEAQQIRSDRQRAWEEHLSHLATQPVLNIPVTWTRDQLYDDDF